jgi:hypothetical protein
MKKFIFIPVIMFGIFLMLSGCYTYLSLSEGAKLAEIPDEPYFPEPLSDPGPPPPPPPRPKPWPIYPHVIDEMLVDKYERTNTISDLRDGGEGRIPNDDRKRR